MKGSTHMAAGCLAAVLIPGITATAAAGLIIGSVLPDIDSEKSLIGRQVPLIPKMLPHRTITHGLLFMILLGMLYSPLGAGVGIHLFLDMFNPDGVKLFYPFKKRFHIPVVYRFVKSGGKADSAIGWLLWTLTLVSCGFLIAGYPIITFLK